MAAPSPGQAVVAPYREISAHMTQDELHRLLDEIAAAIDARCAVIEENARSAAAAALVSLERAIAAEKLAAERLDGLLAAAAFSTVLARQLRLEAP